ncbi:hypothetical protein D9M72_411370 [compost metagenome]
MPKPSTRTENTDGRLWRAAARSRCITSCAAAVACEAAALALVRAPTFTDATTGSPVLLPCTAMLSAFTICSAARFTLPDTRMPASPASMVPSGAIRSMSPAGTSGIGFSVAMPAPVLGTSDDSTTLPQRSYTRLGGV